MSTDDDLLDLLRVSLEPRPLAPPPAAVAALRAAAARRAGTNGHRPGALTLLPPPVHGPGPALDGAPDAGRRDGPSEPRHRVGVNGTDGRPGDGRWRATRRWRTPLAAAAVALFALALGFGGGRLLRQDPPDPEPIIEYAGPLTAPDGSVGAEVTVEKVGIGRVITFDSETLPILPVGELYQVWFVGPDDAPGAPQRISAGTFHPDSDGRSSVQLVAAVDPASYPRIVVTAEPAGGDPAPNGPEVLRATIEAPAG